jgi:hypothetical protein
VLSDWWHEFPVLVVDWRDVRYAIHIHRGWRNAWTDQELPPVREGMSKAASDHLEVHLHGGLEDRTTKDQATLISRFETRWFPTIFIPPILLGAYETAGPYNLFGMNCWGWSRFLIYAILENRTQYVVGASETSAKGAVNIDVKDVWKSFLANPWLNWALLLRSKGECLSGPSSSKTFMLRPSGLAHPVIRRIDKGIRKIEKLILRSPTPSRFYRDRPLEIGVNNASDIHGRALSASPHLFRDGVAIDNDASMYSRALSAPGNFLYLLSPPLSINSDACNVFSIQATVYTTSGNTRIPIHRSKHQLCGTGMHSFVSSEYDILCHKSCMWAETAIVRHNGSDASLYVASDRFALEYDSNDMHSIHLDQDHPIVRQLRNNDMIGLWIQVAYGRLFVRSAEVVIVRG